MKKILGLDLGTNSIGWAVVDAHKDVTDKETFNLSDKGVHIFSEGVKTEKGVESSKAAERTGYRSARRIKFRRKLRKYETLKVLIENKMCPLSLDELKEWRKLKKYPINPNFLEWLHTKEAEKYHPYYLRAQAIKQKLSPLQVGRALYHLAQRRGFLSNRLDSTPENEKGKVKNAIADLSAKIKEAGCKTLGDYFYTVYKRGDRIRNQYTHREEHYLQEFREICKVQAFSDELKKQLEKSIFFQRPLKSQKGLVGSCSFEKNKPRCPVSHPAFEEYRMLCFINNIKIKTPDDEKLRILSDSERDEIKPLFLRVRPSFPFEDIAKKLTPKGSLYKYKKDKNDNEANYFFNYHLKTTVSGCPTSAKLKNIFKIDNWQDEYYQRYTNKQNKKGTKTVEGVITDVWHVLFTFDSDDKLKEFAIQKLLLDEEQATSFAKIKLKQDYARLSLKAINKILPYLREGHIYSYAVFLANIKNVVGEKTWQDNETYIRDGIRNVLDTHREQSRKENIVNELIKYCKDNEYQYSEKAISGYANDIERKLQDSYGAKTWSEKANKEEIRQEVFERFKQSFSKKSGQGDFIKIQRIDERIITFLKKEKLLVNEKKLYHPSDIEIFSNSGNGLASPMVPSVKNPMAMRAMHQLRKVINTLIKKGAIDKQTTVHVEMARELNNANERKAIQDWQRNREKKRAEYRKEIIDEDPTSNPTDTDILKYQLWQEQNKKCVYTGKTINIKDFLDDDPKYDIEHTIPQSLSFDNSQENTTLCENRYNREIKRNKIPSELPNHLEILDRIVEWKKKYKGLKAEIEKINTGGATTKEQKDHLIRKKHKLKRDYGYWKGKYKRFTMKEVPSGFKNSQIVDTGIITRYALAYLKSFFGRVFTVKGSIVAEFRKHWGLQGVFEKKKRVNHIHHCIDAITIACMTRSRYDALTNALREADDRGEILSDRKSLHLPKPWGSFTEDILQVENEVLVSHHTPDNLSKQSKKKLRIRGKIQYSSEGNPIYQQGHTARASLHKDTFYGAIAQNKDGIVSKNAKGEIIPKYVVRKLVSDLKKSDIGNIVDGKIREIVQEGKVKEKKLLKEKEDLENQRKKAEENEEFAIDQQIEEIKNKIANGLYVLPHKGTPKVTPIKKVRCYVPSVKYPLTIKNHKDKSKHLYKQNYYAVNDGNYLMAIYEGINAKGKIKRYVTSIMAKEAVEYYNQKEVTKKNDIELAKIHLEKLLIEKKKHLQIEEKNIRIIKKGTQVLFYQKHSYELKELSRRELSKRLYKIINFAGNNDNNRITFKHHQEARNDDQLREDYETLHGVKPPKTLITGESAVNFDTACPKLRLSPASFEMLIEGIGFTISSVGEILIH